MKNALLSLYNLIGKVYLGPLLRAEQKKRPFPNINERPVEYGFSFDVTGHLHRLRRELDVKGADVSIVR